jgi:hypothetical protein
MEASDMATLDQTYAAIVVRDRDDIGSNHSSNRPLLELHNARMSRRAALKGFITTAAVGPLGPTLTSRLALAAGGGPSTLGFQSLEQVIKEDHQVAPGYSARVLIRWGDPVLAGAPDFDPMRARPPTRRPSSLATIATIWPFSRCRAAPTAPGTACCTSITNTPRKG